jgi:ketosteroid isomerase-like protein
MKKQGRNLFAKALFSLLFSGVIVFWGFQVSAEDWNEAQKEVWKSVEAGWDLFVKGDIDAIAAIAAEGYLEWWPNDPSPFGNDYMKAKYKRWFDGNKPVSYELKPVALNIIGDVANVFYFYKWNGDKMPATISGRQYSTWIKQDNKWKFMGSMGCSCDRRPYCN